MKTIKLIVVFTLVMLTYSCQVQREGPPPNQQHLLLLSFQDVSGNDLLEGSEFFFGESHLNDTIKSEHYTFDYTYNILVGNSVVPEHLYEQEPNCFRCDEKRDPATYIVNKEWFHPQHPLYPLKYDGYRYLLFDAFTPYIFDIPEMSLYRNLIVDKAFYGQKITFKFMCPYLFGNNKVHDIVTWWKQVASFDDRLPMVKCYRIEFEGKEIKVNDIYSGVATITLNK